MAAQKKPTKAQLSKAGKTLGQSKSKVAKSAAGKTLAKKSVTARKVHAAPKKGTVSRASVKKAVKQVKKRK